MLAEQDHQKFLLLLHLQQKFHHLFSMQYDVLRVQVYEDQVIAQVLESPAGQKVA